MTKQLIDEDILKATAENAYNIGYDGGLLKGKIHALNSLADTMKKQNIKNLPYSMIVELLEVLKKEEEKFL